MVGWSVGLFCYFVLPVMCGYNCTGGHWTRAAPVWTDRRLLSSPDSGVYKKLELSRGPHSSSSSRNVSGGQRGADSVLNLNYHVLQVERKSSGTAGGREHETSFEL